MENPPNGRTIFVGCLYNQFEWADGPPLQIPKGDRMNKRTLPIYLALFVLLAASLACSFGGELSLSNAHTAFDEDGAQPTPVFAPSDAIYVVADIANAPEKSPADYSPELTRHFRGLRIYLSLKTYGTQPFQAALEEKLKLTQWAYKKLQRLKQLEFACAPELSLIVFRVKGEDSATQELLRKILDRGRVHMSSTRLNERVYIRMCILSFRSRLAEVQECVTEIQRALSPSS